LLKPGGKLIFTELTVPNMTRTAFAFGLLPGWWLSSEEHRQQSPCVTEQQWGDVLRRNGFSGTDLVFRDFAAEDCHVWSFIVSTATPLASDSAAIVKTLPAPSLPKVTLILDKDSSLQTSLSQDLRSRFEVSETTLDEAALISDHSVHDYIMLDLGKPLLRNLEPKHLSLLQALLGSARSLLWVTAGGGKNPNPDDGMVQGLLRVSHHENNKVALATLGLEIKDDVPSPRHAAHVEKVFNGIASGLKTREYEPEHAEIDGTLHINRVFQANYLNDHIFSRTARPVRLQEFGSGPPLKLNVRARGLLDSLEFIVDESAYSPLAPNEIEVEVKAIGVNFKECLTVLGRVDTDTIGSECAGVVSRAGSACSHLQPGDRVMICVSDSYRTFARVESDQVFKIPDSMTFAEAAALPTAFLTAYYSIVEVARLRKDETILIHAASGGTGQAAIQLAQYIGAEVFATVGSRTKKQLLMDVYNIPADHIFYSRDLSFADGVKRMTNGRGVDTVLNSLSGDGLIASWECVAPFGRFLEIGRKDIDSRGFLPMFPFIKNTTFSGVDLTALLAQRRALGKRMMDEIVSLTQSGNLRPQHPLHMYQISELEQAFRFIQSGKSSGKIIVEVNKDAIVKVSLTTPSVLLRFRCLHSGFRRCKVHTPTTALKKMRHILFQVVLEALGAVSLAGWWHEAQRTSCCFHALDRAGMKRLAPC
jgi:NADPH:quinone reductase-like Zn-dependent oxidoreductase